MSEATSVADILGKQLQKINRIQFAIKLILDSKYESELIPKLYEKYEENEKLVQKLTELKNALTKQDDICKEIKVCIIIDLNFMFMNQFFIFFRTGRHF